MRRAAAIALAVGTFSTAREHRASADPQATAGLTLGGGASDLRTHASAAFQLGARADVLFLRQRDSDMGFGPYVDFVTTAFDTIEPGGGVEWLTPVASDFALILSAGAVGRHTAAFGWAPGVETTAFLGSRSYNFHSWYGLGAGLFVQGRYGFGDGEQADVIAGAQIDLALLAFPFVFAYEALRK